MSAFRVETRRYSVKRLIAEKTPFLFLSAISGVVTLFAQSDTVAPFAKLGLSIRVGNALVSYAEYLIKMVWPVRLAVFYPLRTNVSVFEGAVTAAFLVTVTLFALRTARRRPYLLTGWLWYLITLLPVIGLIQVGFQSMADRYTYIPSIGIFVSLTWFAADLLNSMRFKVFITIPAAAVLVACMILSFKQIGYWKNSATLFNHALGVTNENYVAHNSLGEVSFHDQKIDEAIRHYSEAIRIKPDFDDPHRNLGDALMRLNKIHEAIDQYRAAVEIAPKSAENQSSLGDALIQEGRIDEGVSHYEQIVRFRPDLPRAHFQFGKGLVLLGNAADAVTEFREALRLWPDRIEVLKNLAWILATNEDAAVRNGDEAVRLAEHVCTLTGYKDSEALDILAAAYAESGRYEDAVKVGEKALQLAISSQRVGMNIDIRDRIELYRMHLPYHHP